MKHIILFILIIIMSVCPLYSQQTSLIKHDDAILAEANNLTIEPVKEDFQVNENTDNSSEEQPSIAVADNGNFVVVWVDTRLDNKTIICQFYNADGDPIGENVQVNDGAANCYWPDCAVDGDGNFIIVWSSFGSNLFGVYCQRFTNNGNMLDNENFRVSGYGSAHKEHTKVSADEDGNFVVIWLDWIDNGVYNQYYRCFNNNAEPYSSQVEIQAVPPWSVALNNISHIWLTWSTAGNIYYQCYNFFGGSLTDQIKVNDYMGTYLPRECDISVNWDNNFQIVWSDDRNGNYDIFYQYFSADGSDIGFNMKVNIDTETASQGYPAMSMEMGRTIIVWQDDRNGAWDIYGQLYHKDGSAVNGNYRVNNSVATSIQKQPDVQLVNNRIYYAWEDHRVSGQGYNIFARIDEIRVPLPQAPTNLQAHQIPGQIHITWQDNSDNEDGFELKYLDMATFPNVWKNLVTTGPNVTSYQMDDPIMGHSYIFKVMGYNSAGSSVSSNADTLVPGNLLDYILITSLNGREILTPGESFTITWDTHFAPPIPINFHVNIYYSIDGGSNWVSPAIANDIYDSGSFSWIVPDILTDNCIIKIEGATDGQPYDLSNKPFGIGMAPVAIDVTGDSDIPSNFQLNQNYPNPFNPQTTIQFTLPVDDYVTLSVYNLLGQQVDVLFDGYLSKGNHKAIWNGCKFPGGLYIYRIETTHFSDTRKMCLVK